MRTNKENAFLVSLLVLVFLSMPLQAGPGRQVITTRAWPKTGLKGNMGF